MLELFVLTGFAIAQPLLDLTGRAPELFVYRRVGPADVALFVLMVTLLPTLVIWLTEEVTRLGGATFQRCVHLVFEVLLLAAIAVQVGKHVLADRGYSLLLAGVIVGAGATLVLARSSAARSFVRYLTPAPLVFALLFVVTTPSGQLITASAAEGPAASLVGPTREPPIVMMLFDEFPTNSLLGSDGRIVESVFPNFARLAQRSTWFREATSVTGYSTDAVPALLTGRYPREKVAAVARNYPDNLFSMLADDYVVEAAETISELCPRRECGESAPPPGRETGLVPVFREVLAAGKQLLSPLKSSAADPEEQFAEAPSSAQGEPPAPSRPNFRFAEALAANVPQRLTRFVASLKPSSEPTLHFLHILMPHIPYRYLPSGGTYKASVPRLDDGYVSKPGAIPGGAELTSRQRYMLQLAYTDGLLGQVMQKLDVSGLWDQALVVVTADHGRGFNHGKEQILARRLGANNEHEVAYVPTFIKLPGQKTGVIDDRNWEHVDLVPTIADALGFEALPWDVDGVSALGPPARTRDEKYWYDLGYGSLGPLGRQTFSASEERPLLLAGVLDLMSTPAAGPDRLFRWGPFGALVGKKVNRLVIGQPAEATARIKTGPRVRFNPTSGEVPALISGRVEGARVGTPIAVAINGTIGAVPIVINNPHRQLYTMVLESLFRTGANTIELYLVEGSVGRPLLRPMAVSRLSGE